MQACSWQPMLNHNISQSASRGDVTATKRDLALGADPCAVDDKGNTPLHRAATGLHFAVVEVLLSHRRSDRGLRNADGKLARLFKDGSAPLCIPGALNVFSVLLGRGDNEFLAFSAHPHAFCLVSSNELCAFMKSIAC